MDILNISSKTYAKIIGVCLLIASVTGSIYYATKGGFFDGVLLTFVGLSLTYLILILSVLIFKSTTSLISKGAIKVFHVLLAFIITVSVSGFLFINLFKLIAAEFKF